ncbi:primosomal protein N' [Kroppenstedtia pulmonis]|uniref:primosomal protein N' n=1 Tax=Kroppenstedtia pulmonis TaxID=1380685 RepID=UPI001565055E|nr:primosomal protein N' [Kroppenstedtia pulmonis]
MVDHKRIAQVYVDVAALETDKPFDYLVPDSLQNIVEVGSRVRVPFGSRTRMGYIAGFAKSSSARRLKPLVDVMDMIPPLTPDLVELAVWMSQVYLCPVITVLHAMVPAVLKGKYRQILRLAPDFQDKNLLTSGEAGFFDELTKRGGVFLEEALKYSGITPSLVKEWLKEGRLISEEQVGDRTTRKQVTWVKNGVGSAVLRKTAEELDHRAKRQRDVLLFFADHPGEYPLPEILSRLNVARTTVKRLVEKELLNWEEREEYRDPYAGRNFKQTLPLPLTPEQENAFRAIDEPLQKGHSHGILLQGVTGSGKTEIYLQAITRALELNREAIVLVPEISLTPQMVARFKGRFGSRVAVMHSGLSDGERYDEWRKIRRGEVQVAIGARSAIFAPFSKLGLVIMDEEHESSYKQEEQPKYHARKVAEYRCAQHGAVLVLGTATPEVSTYFRARTGGYQWITLRQRVHGRPFPQVNIVDMREELRTGNRSVFSRPLREALADCGQRGEQAVLFLNRRGFSTFVLCRECGEAVQCPHCDISLTYHRTNRTLRCHYCGYTEPVPQQCPACNSSHIRYFGTGTQRVEEELARSLPGLRVIRMDVDTTGRKGAHERLLSAFGAGKADVLLGTQMIAKGLDFPNVTLVGVIAADTMLHLPDYKASERTFQLLTQVSGRAGRHEKPGRVVVQTYTPEHFSIQMAAAHDVDRFYRQECKLRKLHQYPPFCRLITILFSHQDRSRVMQAGMQSAQRLTPYLPPEAELLGPVPASIPRIKDRYRMQIMIKHHHHIDEKSELIEQLRHLKRWLDDPELRVSIDREGE